MTRPYTSRALRRATGIAVARQNRLKTEVTALSGHVKAGEAVSITEELIKLDGKLILKNRGANRQAVISIAAACSGVLMIIAGKPG